ncbi:MAG: beta-lactamase family protein [Myxococcales bacterium]|nr:beta-lactamase family protein [Myxococcales bacterium]
MTFPGVIGFTATGFESVRSEFERNFADRGEIGAAFCAYRAGEPVVDLWGGLADESTGEAWGEDTLAVIFSGSKGLLAVCILMLVERGALDLETPVCSYWPEFEKQEIRVRDVVSHTARLPGLDDAVSFEEILDPRRMARLLARQNRATDPRTTLTYHPMTFGWLCAELVVRVDGRSFGEFFSAEVAEPLGLDIRFGVPVDQQHRVANLHLSETWPTITVLSETRMAADPLVRSIWGNPPVLSRQGFPWCREDFLAAHIPAAGAVATARSLARLYANLDRLLSPETRALAVTTLSEGWDPLLEVPRHFGVGFQLQTELMEYGPPLTAFGHGGAGGSVNGCWPEERVGFSYVMNLLKDDESDDSRAGALLAALYDCLP